MAVACEFAWLGRCCLTATRGSRRTTGSTATPVRGSAPPQRGGAAPPSTLDASPETLAALAVRLPTATARISERSPNTGRGLSRRRRDPPVQRGAAALAGRFDDVDRPQAVGGPLREQHAASKQGRQLARAKWLWRKRRKRTHDVVGAVKLDPGEHFAKMSRARIARSPAHGHRPRSGCGPRLTATPQAFKLGCVSSDGNAVSLSNTCTTVPHLGDRRTESTSPCSSARTIRRSAATGCTIRKRCRSSSASSLAPVRQSRRCGPPRALRQHG
jgi:hypothetical protein